MAYDLENAGYSILGTIGQQNEQIKVFIKKKLIIFIILIEYTKKNL